jgi:hypothetical protein
VIYDKQGILHAGQLCFATKKKHQQEHDGVSVFVSLEIAGMASVEHAGTAVAAASDVLAGTVVAVVSDEVVGMVAAVISD